MAVKVLTDNGMIDEAKLYLAVGKKCKITSSKFNGKEVMKVSVGRLSDIIHSSDAHRLIVRAYNQMVIGKVAHIEWNVSGRLITFQLRTLPSSDK